MSIASLGTTFTPGGQLTFSWDDASLQGVTLPDSAIIFAIRYDLVGAPGTQTPVDFSSLITQLEFTDTSLAPIGYTTFSGLVEITAPQDILTDSLAGPYCPGQTISVGYTTIGSFNAGNTFYAELSDAAGSFATPDTIGSVMDTVTGTIAATIPSATPNGTNYRIRVVSDDPTIIGVDNTINLTIGDIQDSVSVSICTGDSIFAGGGFQTTSGTYVDTLTSVAGCDSIVTTSLTVLTDLSDSVSVNICDGDSLFAGGAFQTTSGTYVDTLTASGGCDSVVTTLLTVLPNASNTENTNICEGDSLFAGGAFQTTSGTYIDTLVAANGCDSILTTVLTVLPNASNTVSLSICQGDSVFAGGAFQTTTGIYVDTLIAANGCDSILTTNLTVTPVQGATNSISICQGDSVFAGGAFQTVTGTYVDTLTAASGCDSLVTTNLTVLSSLGSTQSISICLGDSFFVGGAFQTTPGIYTDTLPAAGGCDSIVTTNLTVNFSASTASANICQGDSFFVGGAFQTLSGIYTDTLTAASGCDSVITTTLTVTSNSGATLTATICLGDSIFIAGAFRTAPGVYPDTLIGASGCDSIVNTLLNVNFPSQTSLSFAICQGDSFFAGGAFQTVSGVYRDTLTAANGCDSVVTTQLTVIPTIRDTVILTICDGDSVFAGGAFQTTSGIYVDAYLGGTGCDSLVITDLTVVPLGTGTVNQAICAGDTFVFGGNPLTVSGTYLDTLAGANGCDSVVTLNLTVNPLPPTPTITPAGSASLCAGSSLILTSSSPTGNLWSPGGQTAQAITVTASGSYSVTVTDANGCRATAVPTVVTVNPLPTVGLGPDTVLCSGGSLVLDAGSGFNSYLWTGGAVTQTLTVSATGTYIVTVTDANGCSASDSINVVIAPPIVVDLGPDTTACAGSTFLLDAGAGFVNYAWTPGGQTTQMISVNASGTYGVTVTDVNGCTANDQVNIVFSGAVNVNLGPDQETCQGGTVLLDAGPGFANYSWTPGGQTTQTLNVNTTGVYSVTVTDANGCTGSDAVQVTVWPNPVVDLGPDTTVCGGTSYTLDAGSGYANYLWNPGGQATQTITVTQSGIYQVEITDGNNCTDRDTINLTFGTTIPLSLGPDIQTVCDGEVLTLDAGPGYQVYDWNTGSVAQSIDVTTAGIYFVEVQDNGGCLARDTVEVQVLAGPTSVFTATPSGLTVSFTDQSTGGITSWNWAFGDGGGSNAQNPTYTYMNSGTYEVCLTTVDTSGCRDTSCVTIMLTGLEEGWLGDQVTVYPNPANTQLFVEFELAKAEAVNISLVNLLGQQVLTLPTERIGNGRVELDLSRISQGMYFLRIEGAGGIFRRKIEVKR